MNANRPKVSDLPPIAQSALSKAELELIGWIEKPSVDAVALSGKLIADAYKDQPD
jgi:hypothetical protein